MYYRLKSFIPDLRISLLFSFLFLALMSNPVWAKKNYTFEGTLKVRLDSKIEHTGNSVKPLAGVQLRVVRAKSPTRGAVGKHGMTDSQGDFKFSRKFARDRNGFLPGGKKLRFKVQARFRNSALKIRKGGWLKNNWFTIARCRGKNGKDFDFNDVIMNNSLKNNISGKHAQIWWVYQVIMEKLHQNNVGIAKRVVVIYPDRSVRQAFHDNSWYLFRIHLAQADWHDVETMIHELIHQWDINYLKGTASIVCLADAHHKSPSNWRSSRCSGFMEGFAQAVAARLTQKHFGAGKPGTYTHYQLRKGKGGLDYKIQTLDEAERTDVGWYNFLTLFWLQNEWNYVGGSVAASKNPTDVPVYRVLQVLARERPRKAKWLFKGNATFKWFTNIMKKNLRNFDSWDARVYRLYGDPSLTGKEIHQKVTSGGSAGSQRKKHQGVGGKTNFTGIWETNFGELRLRQIQEYVIGDYSDVGIILGKINGAGGDCLSGVFTNGESNGIFRLYATSTDTFEGKWAWHGNSLRGTWKGEKIEDSVSDFRNFTRDDSVTTYINNTRSDYDGTYSSRFGKVTLFSRHLFLIGDYGGKGIIAGMWDGNSFVGLFTNEGRTGWFDWAFFSRNASFRSGKWGWVGGGSKGSWKLNEQREFTPEIENMNDDVNCNQ